MRFARLGQFLVARRRWVLVVGLLAVVAAGMFGADVASKLSNGGFEDPSSDGAKATAILDDHFGAGEPNVILLVRADGTSVDDPAVAAAGQNVTDRLAAADGVSDVVSYWSLGSPPPLRADDSSSALVLGRINGSEDEIRDSVDTIRDELTFDDGTINVGVSGREAVFAEMGETIEKDLALAEMIAFPITLILLIFVFRSLIAAILPLAVGGLAIIGTFFVLEVLAGLTTVSIFALNLTTAMGLGLAIDYSLFVISRYREEREAGYTSNDAVIRSVATAGRAVFFSGLTVAVSLSALLVFPIAFLRSFAYAGVPVVALAVLGAVVVLPAGTGRARRPHQQVLTTSSQTRSPRGRGHLLVATRHCGHAPAGSRRGRIRRRAPGARHSVPAHCVRPARRSRADDRSRGAASQRPDPRRLRIERRRCALGGPAQRRHDDTRTDRSTTSRPQLSSLDGVARVDAPSGIYIEGSRVIDEPPLADRFVTDDTSRHLDLGGAVGRTHLGPR